MSSKLSDMTDINEIKKFWSGILLNKKITKVFFNSFGFTGFMLNDGTKVEYDQKDKGIHINLDAKAGTPIKYN